MYGDYPIPYDRRKYNGFKSRTDAAIRYLKDNIIARAEWGKIWKIKTKQMNMELEIFATNVSDNPNDPLYRPTVRYRIPGISQWSIWQEELRSDKNFYWAKQYALTKFCAVILPGAVNHLFPKAFQEEDGIAKIL